MPFTTTMTTVTDLDDSIVLAFEAGFIVAAEQGDVMSPFVQYRADINAKSIQFPKYNKLAPATTPLTEDEDVASTAMVDAPILFTPTEYGRVVTRTALASLQTGGKADLAAARLVGDNVSRTLNVLATRALEATTNVMTVGDKTEANILAGDVITGANLNRVYNKLARASIPALSDGLYVAIMHDDVINDLRAGAAAGDWTDVVKYARPEEALTNEVGVYKGFRIIRNNDCAFVDQTGAGTVDVYDSCFFGFNALGLAVSRAPGLVITQTDKLNRFLNVGWYGVHQHKIVDMDAVWKFRCASSVGANAS
jgi:N4-gp56 family major capsid protein